MNNIAILKKCLAELSKDDFRKDYVVGMLETLVEMQETPVKIEGLTPYVPIFPVTSGLGSSAVTDEGSLLDATARASLAKTMELAAKSHE